MSASSLLSRSLRALLVPISAWGCSGATLASFSWIPLNGSCSSRGHARTLFSQRGGYEQRHCQTRALAVMTSFLLSPSKLPAEQERSSPKPPNDAGGKDARASQPVRAIMSLSCVRCLPQRDLFHSLSLSGMQRSGSDRPCSWLQAVSSALLALLRRGRTRGEIFHPLRNPNTGELRDPNTGELRDTSSSPFWH